MRPPEPSRTAVLTCQGRAVADGRLAVGRLRDPLAFSLLRLDEQVAVAQVRSGTAPKGWDARVEYETVRATAEVMVPRTIAIDDALRARSTSQLVVVGAGLDTRAWRMSELVNTDVFEVDHPASQADKHERLGTIAALARNVTFVPVDFTTDDLAGALEAAGHHAVMPTTWVWEGVVPYLAPGDVELTMHAIALRSAEGSRLVVNYQAPSAAATVGRLFARAMSALNRRRSPWATEPIRSTWTPADMAALAGRHGFTVERDDDLLTLARGLGVDVRNPTSLRTGRVAIAAR